MLTTLNVFTALSENPGFRTGGSFAHFNPHYALCKPGRQEEAMAAYNRGATLR